MTRRDKTAFRGVRDEALGLREGGDARLRAYVEKRAAQGWGKKTVAKRLGVDVRVVEAVWPAVQV